VLKKGKQLFCVFLSGILVIGITLVGISYYQDKIELVDTLYERDLYKNNNKALVQKLISYEIRSDVDPIIGLRDYVYNSTIVGPGNFNYSNPVDHFISMTQSEVSMLCGGMSVTYKWLLSMFDIPARTVQLATKEYLNGEARYDSHITVEVYDKKLGKWYVSDPTFNISLKCNDGDNAADVEELRACVVNGRDISYIRDGIKYIKGRTIEEYYLPYDKLLYAVNAEQVEEINSGNIIKKDNVDLPKENWGASSSVLYDK
jgi:hypothetical protein